MRALSSQLEVLNTTRGILLVDRGERASCLVTRAKGLIGRDALEPGQGLLVSPCQGIHTFLMRFPIDALYLDKSDRIIRVVRAIPPNRIGPFISECASVLELPAGTIDTTGTQEGDMLSVRCA